MKKLLIIGDTAGRSEKLSADLRRSNRFAVHVSLQPKMATECDLLLLPAQKIDLIPRNKKETPVMVYGEAQFFEAALTHGAEDFLREPWSCEEALLRAEKVVKRSSMVRWPYGVLEATTRSLFYRGRTISIGVKEYVIIKYLMRFEGDIVPREVLLERFYDTHHHKSRSIDARITSLRQKILFLLDGDPPEFPILSVRKMGYLLASSQNQNC